MSTAPVIEVLRPTTMTRPREPVTRTLFVKLTVSKKNATTLAPFGTAKKLGDVFGVPMLHGVYVSALVSIAQIGPGSVSGAAGRSPGK